jgi:Pro-kumamolisin, activation domain/HlyD family secretion protein
LQQELVDAQLQLKAATVEYKNLQAKLQSDLMTERAGQAIVNADNQLAQKQAQTDKALYQLGVISGLTYDASEGKADEYTTRTDIEKQRLDVNKNAIATQLEVQQTKVEQAKTLLALKQRRLDALTVKAGIQGVLVDLPHQVGEHVSPGTTLAKVVQPDQLKATLKIAETQARDIQIGQPAEIDTHNGVIPGSVVRIDPAVQNGTVTVDVQLTGSLPQGARPDLSVAGSGRTSLKGSVHPSTARYPDSGHADGSQALLGMTIYFAPSASQQAALTSLLAEQQAPGSPGYHRWLTPAQFANQFGLASSDVAAVTSWLQQQGFQIVSASPLSVKFSGALQQVENAFDTRIDNYSVDGVVRRANATPLSIPAALDGVISGIQGMNEFRPKPHIRRPSQPHYTFGSGNYFVAPGDFATIYDVNALYNEGYTGSGQTIAIVGQSSIEATDVANFRSAAALPPDAPTFTLVPNSGTSEAYSNDEEESDLDVEWSGAVAKNASINFVYVGDNQNYDVFDALQYAIEQKLASVVSISYGGCEANWSATDISSLTTLFEQANSQGQTIIATAGDNGAADCDEPANAKSVVTAASDGLAVDFPGSSPYVTTIGGTEFYADSSAPGTYWNSSNGSGDSSALQYIPEEVWNDTSTQIGLEGGGSGVSMLFSKPSWQTGLGVPNDGRRDLPDLSLNASPQHDGYVYCSSAADSTSCSSGFNNSKGQPDIAGGTSFGAPSFAAILTLINQKEGSSGQGNFNPAIYGAANSNYSSAFHDVQRGTNDVPCVAGSVDCGSSGEIGYSAGVGYDLATGWGSIDASAFAAAVAGTTTTGSGASSTVVVTAGRRLLQSERLTLSRP